MFSRSNVAEMSDALLPQRAGCLPKKLQLEIKAALKSLYDYVAAVKHRYATAVQSSAPYSLV
jgi:hypothetical protein